jgi:cytochrome c
VSPSSSRATLPAVLGAFHLVVTLTSPGAAASAPPGRGGQECDPGRFEKEVLVAAADDPMQLEVLPDGRVLFIEHQGKVKLWNPATREVKLAGAIPVIARNEIGLLGVVADRRFADTGFLYFHFSAKKPERTMRVARMVLRGDRLDLGSEVAVLEYPFERGQHMGGGLAMDARGNLIIGTGDDSNHIPDPPVDVRPGQEQLNAFRSSADTRDLRGKVLRIHPQPDGGYTIPPDNLFPDGRDGRPEILAMGIRNAFRLSVDDRTGWVYQGEVGPNTSDDFKGKLPPGYDEINQIRRAGNFGWPLFTGPNEPHAVVDYETGKVGPPFSVANPVNPWPRIKGIKNLPPPQPPLIWYPTTESKEFPQLGSGGRTAMAGPVYHFDQASASTVKLPACLDGKLFVYDWSRNWIKTVKLDAFGQVAAIEPFMPGVLFRKPIDLKIAPDGSLYLVEFGDTWGGNRDGQVTRVVYRRGNRAPVARASASPRAGKRPLVVRFDGGASSDRDRGDRLAFVWRFDDGVVARGPRLTRRFDKPGRYRVTLTVTDAAGASDSASTEIHVGNAPPRIEILSPANGGFVDPGQRVRYRVVAADEEDGSTADGRIPPHRVVVWGSYRTRLPALAAGHPEAVDHEPGVDPGLALIRRSSCFSCHHVHVASVGPPFVEVARRYRNDRSAHERLAQKVLAGGGGVWDEHHVMPPQPQHTLAEAGLMVAWILSLADRGVEIPSPGLFGELVVPKVRGRLEGGAYLVQARYVDAGANGQPPLGAEAAHVLHSRRRAAAYADTLRGAEVLDDFGGEGTIIVHLHAGGSFGFRSMNLEGVDRLAIRAANMLPQKVTLEVRLGSPAGPRLTTFELTGRTASKLAYQEIILPVRPPAGMHEVVVLARGPAGARGKAASVRWVEFQSRPQTRILVIAGTGQSPWESHLLRQGAELIARCLDQTPGVEAVVSPDPGWPTDPKLLEKVSAIVHHASPADRLLVSERQGEMKELLDLGVGMVAIPSVMVQSGGPDNTGAVRVVPVDRAHPVNRGFRPHAREWAPYSELPLDPRARPLLRARLGGRDQLLAWAFEREGGGRSFGTAPGRLLESLKIEAFRRMVVNGILWAAKREVPTTGANVALAPDELTPPPRPRAFVRDWKLSELAPALAQVDRSRSYRRGRELFSELACNTCHKLNGEGSGFGPDLGEIRQRRASGQLVREELLRELLEPARVVAEPYRIRLLRTRSGETVSGLVVGRTDQLIRLVPSPASPEVLHIPRADLAHEEVIEGSMMPEGLLVTLTEEEIWDLLAFLEAGGDQTHPPFARK